MDIIASRTPAPFVDSLANICTAIQGGNLLNITSYTFPTPTSFQHTPLSCCFLALPVHCFISNCHDFLLVYNNPNNLHHKVPRQLRNPPVIHPYFRVPLFLLLAIPKRLRIELPIWTIRRLPAYVSFNLHLLHAFPLPPSLSPLPVISFSHISSQHPRSGPILIFLTGFKFLWALVGVIFIALGFRFGFRGSSQCILLAPPFSAHTTTISALSPPHTLL